MNLSIHLALTLSYLGCTPYLLIDVDEPTLSALFVFHSKTLKLIQNQNIKRALPTCPDKKSGIASKVVSFLVILNFLLIFFILQIQKI